MICSCHMLQYLWCSPPYSPWYVTLCHIRSGLDSINNSVFCFSSCLASGVAFEILFEIWNMKWMRAYKYCQLSRVKLKVKISIIWFFFCNSMNDQDKLLHSTHTQCPANPKSYVLLMTTGDNYITIFIWIHNDNIGSLLREMPAQTKLNSDLVLSGFNLFTGIQSQSHAQ